MTAEASAHPTEPSGAARWTAWLDRHFRWLLLLGVVTHLSGLVVTLMEPDAALYATVARTMAETGDFVRLFARGTDWLDKPHFPFWVTALSFRAFGVNEVAYKLPALLFFAMGVVYTWLFARRLYSPTVARLAVLIVLSAQHLVMSNNDVRAEPYLTGLLIAAIYHLVRATERTPRAAWHVVPGALFGACAVMTKGPFIVIPIALSLVTHWAVHRDWRQLLRPRWYAALLLLAVFVTPELYALYVQFDLHPEKVVFGRTGVSGIRFFFWDAQFGRFLDTGPIRGKGDPTFFLHTLLWAFLPWSLLLYAALFSRLRRLREAPELYSLGAALPMLVVFSLSRFQLPHYTNILFPFFAVITAAWLVQLSSPRADRAARLSLHVVAGVMLIVVVVLFAFFRPPGAWIAIAAFLVVVAAGVLQLLGRELPPAVGRAFVVACYANVALNLAFYPALLKYQSGSEAARLQATLPPARTGMYEVNSYAFELYSPGRIERWNLGQLAEAARAGGAVRVLLPEEKVRELEAAGLEVKPLQRFEHFHVTRLKPRFLDASTRAQVLEYRVLAEVRPAK